MKKASEHLLTTRRFLPLFVKQFLGAFNDNIYKNALVVLITYRLADAAGVDAQLYVTAAAGLFILPFFLFSSLAGELGDKLEKSRLIQVIKLYEIVLCLIAALGFYLANINVLLLILFMLGAQSAFFGPLKYGILPDHLKTEELVAGNALIEAGTFIAILGGTIIGGLLILGNGGEAIISGLLLLVAIMGFLASRKISAAPAAIPDLKINPNIIASSYRICRDIFNTPPLMAVIFANSWFWFAGATYLAQFPTYGKEILGADETVVTLFLTIFSIGIGIGSMLCHRLIGDHIRLTYVPIAALLMAYFGFDLYWISQDFLMQKPDHMLTINDFWQLDGSLRVLIDFAGFSVAGGLYIVPLYAMMQARSPINKRARVVAVNNITNSFLMVGSAVFTAWMFMSGYQVHQVFLAVSLMNLPIAYLTLKLKA